MSSQFNTFKRTIAHHRKTSLLKHTEYGPLKAFSLSDVDSVEMLARLLNVKVLDGEQMLFKPTLQIYKPFDLQSAYGSDDGLYIVLLFSLNYVYIARCDLIYNLM